MGWVGWDGSGLADGQVREKPEYSEYSPQGMAGEY
jgi:hypothetical protein